MRVRVGELLSDWEDVLSGVPQRSILGLLLFLLFVNDLPDWVRSQILMFADDTKIWAWISRMEDSAELQQDLDNLMKWSQAWLLNCNPEKCKIMHIGHNILTAYRVTVGQIVYALQEIERRIWE
jgi:Reverse transcriptase (RNA-dependent DNA polymerase)